MLLNIYYAIADTVITVIHINAIFMSPYISQTFVEIVPRVIHIKPLL